MANTPKYTFTTPSPYNAAISGGMTALGGIMAEKASSQKSADQLNNFASVLRQEGLVGDAMIYEQMALAQEPDFVSAALTGKPTDRSLTQPFDHALKIFDRKATNEARLAEANARSGQDSEYRRLMAIRDDTADERALYASDIMKLRAEYYKKDDEIRTAENRGKPERVRELEQERKVIADRIAELEAKQQGALGVQKEATQNIGGGGGATNVGRGDEVPTSRGGLQLPPPPEGGGDANQGSPLLPNLEGFGSATPENLTPIGEQEPPQGAVASPATLAPFDKAAHLGNALDEFNRLNPPASVAPLPSPSAAASQAPAVSMPDVQPFRRGRMGLPGAPERERYDPQLAQAADEFRAASAPAAAPTPAVEPDDPLLRGPLLEAVKRTRTPLPYPMRTAIGPVIEGMEVRKALPVEEGGLLGNLGATPAEEGGGVIRTPDSEVYKALAPDAEVQKQITEGVPEEEESPAVKRAGKKLQAGIDRIKLGYRDVGGVDENGKTTAERLVEGAQDLDDIDDIEATLKSYKDSKGEWANVESALDDGERVRRLMKDDGKLVFTSIKRDPRTAKYSWHHVKRSTMVFDGQVWRGEDGTMWYPDPKTNRMVKKAPGEDPVWETELNNPNVAVTKTKFEADNAKLHNSKIFKGLKGENIPDKTILGGATGGEGTPTPPQPPAGAEAPAAPAVAPAPPAASKTPTGNTLKSNAETAIFFQ